MDHFVAVQGFCDHTEQADADPQAFADGSWSFDLEQSSCGSERVGEILDWLLARDVRDYEPVVLVERTKTMTGSGTPVLVVWGQAGFRFEDPGMAMLFKLTFGGSV